MSLTEKFRDAVATPIVSIGTLHRDEPYPVVGARRTQTKYGMRIVLALNEVDRGNIVEVFLPKRYSEIIEDADLDSINTKQLQYNLTYRGPSPSSKAIILQLGLQSDL
jgi:hypothetical protein